MAKFKIEKFATPPPLPKKQGRKGSPVMMAIKEISKGEAIKITKISFADVKNSIRNLNAKKDRKYKMALQEDKSIIVWCLE